MYTLPHYALLSHVCPTTFFLPMHDLLAGYPVVIELPVAWGEMDAYQHVNNIVYFRYFESGRIAYFQQIGWLAAARDDGIGPILASVSCRFKFPLTFPDRIRVGTRIDAIGDDRLTMHHRVVSTRHGRVAADGEGVIVAYNYRENRKALLPADVRALLAFPPAAQGKEIE